jgi:hypothetical protein
MTDDQVVADADLISKCAAAAGARQSARVMWEAGLDTKGDAFFEKANSMLQKIMKIRPVSQPGLRAKATLMFRMGYQPSGDLSDRVVVSLLQDIGISAPEFLE